MAVTLDEELRKAGEPRRLGNEQAMKGKRLRPQRQVQEPPSKCIKSRDSDWASDRFFPLRLPIAAKGRK